MPTRTRPATSARKPIYAPAPVQKQGNLILGLGVEVDSIVQKIDRFVQERLVGARGDRANAEVQEQVYRDLEMLLNELSADVDLSSSLTGFFNAVDEVLKDPGNVAHAQPGGRQGHRADGEHRQSAQPRVRTFSEELERPRDCDGAMRSTAWPRKFG